MAKVKQSGKYICVKCESEIKRLAVSDSSYEKWTCPKCGDVNKAKVEEYNINK